MTTNSIFRLVVVLCLVANAAAFHLSGQAHSIHPGSGEEWLAWSASERQIFVLGYTYGNGFGTARICRDADLLFETNEQHHQGYAGHPSDFPSARCLAARPAFSRARSSPNDPIGLSAYTGVITEFYTKHPEYRRVPYFHLMMLLNDKDYKTADQLFEMAKRDDFRSVYVY